MDGLNTRPARLSTPAITVSRDLPASERIGHELNPSKHSSRQMGYYERDSYFVDVAEAQNDGLLPNINKDGKIGEKVMPADPITGRRPCAKSLT